MTDGLNWLEIEDVLYLHDEQIALYGGALGVLNPGALESTIARPKNLALYGEPDIFDLAASYAFGFARNHCFVDGNKRVALASALVFLADRRFLLVAGTDEVVSIIEGVAKGDISEQALGAWLRKNSLATPD